MKIFFLKNKRSLLFSFIFAFFLFLSVIWGFCLDNYLSIWHNIEYWILTTVFIAVSIFAFLLFRYMDKFSSLLNKIKAIPIIEKTFFNNDKSSFRNCFLFISICYTPVLMAYFPGIFTYDTYYQANFFVNMDLIEIHPFLHSLLIYMTLLFSSITKNATIGILIYTLIQSIIMISIFSYCIKIISKYTSSFIFRLFALLFFALYPTNPLFCILATKDTLFSGFVLLTITLLFDLIFSKQDFFYKKFNLILLSSSILFVFLFRHNGLYGYLLLLPFLIIWGKNNININMKKFLVTLLIPIILYSGYTYIKKAIGIKPAPIASLIGIPLQQMSRTHILYENEMPIQDIIDWQNIVSERKTYVYDPLCVDILKIDSPMLHSDFIQKSITENPKRFINLYIKWAKQYPKTYIDAFLHNTYGYWYPLGKYNKQGLHYYLFIYNRWTNICGIEIPSYCFNPYLKKVYDSIFLNTSFEKNPITFICFSMPCNLWIILFSIFYLVYKKKYNYIIPFIFSLALFLTVLLGPICLLRYIYQNYLIIPLLFTVTYGNINTDIKESEERTI